MTIEFILVFFGAYFLGALPFALIFVKLFAKKDIRKIGTGNVGAMNSYESTGRKHIGFIVLIFDLLKGFFAVLIARHLFNDDYMAVSIAASGAVLGHNFNIFLKFKGGRGLATAAGAFLYINPIMIIAWFFGDVLGFFIIKRQVHVGAFCGTILAPFIMYLLPENIIESLNIVEYADKLHLVYLSASVCFIILLRHIEPIFDLINQGRK